MSPSPADQDNQDAGEQPAESTSPTSSEPPLGVAPAASTTAAAEVPDDDIVDAEIVPDAAPDSPGSVPGPADRTSSELAAASGSPVESSSDRVAAAADFAAPAGPGTAAPGFDYTDAGVPTLDYVRSKVEGRLGTAHGSAELAQDAADRDAAAKGRPPRPDPAQVQADREKAAHDRLEAIRKSLRSNG